MDPVVVYVALFVVSFLLGSIPFGLIISKVFYHTDIREHGSGSIGTTNAIRTMGKVGGYSVFVLDFGKGVLSGVLALVAADYLTSTGSTGLLSSHDLVALAFMGCIWGHIFSPWLKFKGGKGIAVAVGCLVVMFGFVGMLIEVGLFALLVIVTRYVSVGSIAAAAICPFLSLYFYWGDWVGVVCCTLAALTVIWAHRSNISRLLSGTESRVGSKKEKAS